MKESMFNGIEKLRKEMTGGRSEILRRGLSLMLEIL